MSIMRPSERLASIVGRSGKTYTELAKALGYRHASGIHQYVSRARGDKLIPYDVIKGLIPLLQGAGSPPITRDELIAISEVKDAGFELSRLKPPNGDVHTPHRRSTSETARCLPIRYVVEAGVYMDPDAASQRAAGTGPISVSPEYGDQFGAVVASGTVFSRGDVLHCVPLTEIAPARAAGKPCVCSVPRGDLVSIEIRSMESDGRSVADGSAVKVLGIVVAYYTRT